MSWAKAASYAMAVSGYVLIINLAWWGFSNYGAHQDWPVQHRWPQLVAAFILLIGSFYLYERTDNNEKLD